MSNAKHILIVDDEPNVRLVFRTALATEGCAIATADFPLYGRIVA